MAGRGRTPGPTQQGAGFESAGARTPSAQGHDSRIQTYRPFRDVIDAARWTLAAGRAPGRLTKDQYRGWCLQSGIHADTLGAVYRAAAELGWVLMFRGLRDMAKEHAGEYSVLPKPMEIKIKCDQESGLVCCTEAELADAIDHGKVVRTYAETQKLKVARTAVRCKDGQTREKNLLVNAQGQGFYSDMDLFAVLDLWNGERIMMGTGEAKDEAIGSANRTKLDQLINILTPLGAQYDLIQHGSEYDWPGHKPADETIAAFVPFGPMLVINSEKEAVEFMLEIQRQANGYII
jgi:hypothetical protein